MPRSAWVSSLGTIHTLFASPWAIFGFDVRLYNRSEERLAPIIERGGLDKIGALGEGFVELPVITTDLGAALTGADLVMLTVPISTHPFFAQGLAELLDPGQVLFLDPDFKEIARLGEPSAPGPRPTERVAVPHQ